jgi:hypothetical protein
MSTANDTTLAARARVRIINPRHRLYNHTGVIVSVHHAESDCPSYLVSPDCNLGFFPFGAGELEVIAPPAPRLADVDWARFVAEAEALGAEMYAEWHPVNGISRAEAAMCAGAEVQRRYEVELAELAAQAEQLAAVKRAAAVARAARKAAYHLAGGLDIRRAPDGAYLVPSGTRGGVIHRVSADGQACSCESTGHCWHLSAVAQVEAQSARVVFPVRQPSTRAA